MYGTCVRKDFFDGSKPETEVQEYQTRLKELFSFGIIQNAGKFAQLRPRPFKYYWLNIDLILDWFESAGMELKYHGILWGFEAEIPTWFVDLPTQQDRLQALEDHVRNIIRRYRGRIKTYDITNECLSTGSTQNWMDTGKSSIEVVNLALSWAREEDPEAFYIVNETGFGFGSWPGVINGAAKRAEFITLLNQTSADAAGIEFHFNEKLEDDEIITSSLTEISEQTNLTIHITEFDILPPADPSQPFLGFTSWWEYQAYAYKHAYSCLFNKYNKIDMWGFYDGAHWRPGAGLFDESFTPKPAYHSMKDLLRRGK